MPVTELVPLLGRWSAGRGPLYLLLARRLRELIEQGELAGGTGLPTDRALALGLAVGRTTVVAAYDQLREDGRVVRRQGSGTWVTPVTPVDGLRPPIPIEATVNPIFLNLLDQPDDVLQFACAGPTAAPPACVAAYRAATDHLGQTDLGYHPAGHPRLRQALARRYTAHAVPTTPDQILVTTGGQQALALLVRALVAAGDEVLVQAPTYPGMLEVLREAAAVIRSVPVHDNGFPTRLADRPALAYLIATFHNPTGYAVPAAEADATVAAARRHRVPLIVDDATADLGFDPAGARPPTAAAPAADEVITVGSLSKVVWGGLRVGWIRAQPALIGRLARLKAVHDLGTAVLDQLAAVELLAGIDEVSVERAGLLRRRHDHLTAALRHRLPDWRFQPADGGQTLWVRLPVGDAAAFAQTALRHGIAVLPGRSLDPTGSSTDHLRLSFVDDYDRLDAAVDALSSAWRCFTGA